MEQKTYYYVYQITNKVNGKIYVGAHSTANLDDGYMGSGIYLKNAIQKYGEKNFEKQILAFYDGIDEMFLGEAEIVTPEFVLREDTYNMMTGGIGGRLGVKQSPEMISKRIATRRASGSYLTENTSQYGTVWITNGIRDDKIVKGDPVPEGWELGRCIHTLEWYTSLTEDARRQMTKHARAEQQRYWDENPEEFKRVLAKREETRKANQAIRGTKYRSKLTKEEKSAIARANGAKRRKDK